MRLIGGPNGQLTLRERLSLRAGTTSPEQLTSEARWGYYGTISADSGAAPFFDEGLVDLTDPQDNVAITGEAADAAAELYADALALRQAVMADVGRTGVAGAEQAK